MYVCRKEDEIELKNHVQVLNPLDVWELKEKEQRELTSRTRPFLISLHSYPDLSKVLLSM